MFNVLGRATRQSVVPAKSFSQDNEKTTPNKTTTCIWFTTCKKAWYCTSSLEKTGMTSSNGAILRAIKYKMVLLLHLLQ